MAELPEPFDLTLWLVENAIREHRRPETADLLNLLESNRASRVVLDYIAKLNGGQPFNGRPPVPVAEYRPRMERAVALIRKELERAKKNGSDISLTEAVKRASKRAGGPSESALWEMVKLYKVHHDREDI